MKKTDKILEVENRFGESIEALLQRTYVDEKMKPSDIATLIGASQSSIRNWIAAAGIQRRSASESKLSGSIRKPSKSDLERMYLTELKNPAEIAEEVGVSQSSIRNWIKEYEIPKRDVSQAQYLARHGKKPPTISREELERLYVEEGKTMQEVGDLLGYNLTTIARWMDHHDIARRNHSERALPRDFEVPSREYLERRYVDEEASINEIARELEITPLLVRKSMDERGIERRPHVGVKLAPGVVRPSRDELYAMHHEEGKRTDEMAEEVGVCYVTIRKWMREDDIEILPVPSANLQEGAVRPSAVELRRMYVDEKMSLTEIAEFSGASVSSIRNWMDAASIQRRKAKIVKEVETPRGTVRKEVERMPGEDLRRMYVEENLTIQEIAEQGNIANSTVRNWLDEEGIEWREKAVEMPKEKLEEMFIERGMNLKQIAKEFGVNPTTIGKRLDEYGIPRKKLRKSIPRPSKEELVELYHSERKTVAQIAEEKGVSVALTRNWMNDYDIERRTPAESRLPEGFEKPSKEYLEMLYHDQRMNLDEVAKEVGAAVATLRKWMNEYDISRRDNSGGMKKEHFLSFLERNEEAQKLAAASLALEGGERADIERIITEVYSATFRSQKELRILLDDSRSEIYELIQEGVTNLGSYIGEYTLEDRTIIPVLMGSALGGLGEGVITVSLEERISRFLRNQYGPQFNSNPAKVIGELEERVNDSEGGTKRIYEGLYAHYVDVLQLGEELASY